MKLPGSVFCLTLFFLFQFIKAQYNSDEFKTYTCLRSEGEIPELFTKLTQEGYIEDLRKIAFEEDKKTITTKKKFYLESNQFINDLLLSGRVLFGDPVTNYINKVAGELLKNETELKNELNFYTLKSTSVNALSTDKGIILINIGLIARLHNEAELAFVLAHEISHYTGNHVMDFYLEKKGLIEGSGKYKGATYDSKIDIISTHSKEAEFEADSLGIIKIVNSKFNSKSVGTTFDILHYSYLPFEEQKFDIEYFNNGDFIVPNCYFSYNLSPISKEEDYNDEDLLHPNIHKRRLKYEQIVNSHSEDNKQFFLNSENEFEYIRELARFETVRLSLIRRQYCEAIYDSYLLLKKHKNNKFLELSIAKALYGLSKYKNAGKFQKVIRSYNKIEGESQQVNYFFRQLDQKQLNLFSLRYICKMVSKYPDDTILKGYRDDLIYDLVFYNKTSFKELTISYKNSADNLDFETIKNIPETEKRKKIRECQNETRDFCRVAISDDIDTNGLYKIYLEAEKNAIEFKAFDDLKYKEKETIIEEELQNINLNGYQIHADKIILFDPYYAKYDHHGEIIPIESEEKKIELTQNLINEARLQKIDLYPVDSKGLGKDDLHKFWMLSVLNDWILEKFTHDELEFIPSQMDHINQVDINKGYEFLCQVFVIIDQKNNKSYYNFSLFSLKTGKLIYKNRIRTNGSISNKKLLKLFNSDFSNIKS